MSEDYEDYDQPAEYHVYIRSRYVGVAYNELDAWKLVGQGSFGSTYEVRDENGEPIESFIPF